MPRYFFNTHNGHVRLDRDGVDLAGPDAARATAMRAAGEVLQDGRAQLWDDGEWWIWVTSEAGETICSLRLSADASPSHSAGVAGYAAAMMNPDPVASELAVLRPLSGGEPVSN